MTNITDNVKSNFFVCDVCEKTNWFTTVIVEDGFCGVTTL